MTRLWIVRFGTVTKVYFTDYHASQFCEALTTNKTPWTLETREAKPC